LLLFSGRRLLNIITKPRNIKRTKRILSFSLFLDKLFVTACSA
jgi:hypothetical protein